MRASVAFDTPWDARPCLQAWGALAVGRKFEEPEVVEVVGRHPGSSAPGVLLAWSLQKGFVPLITSLNPAHQVRHVWGM